MFSAGNTILPKSVLLPGIKFPGALGSSISFAPLSTQVRRSHHSAVKNENIPDEPAVVLGELRTSEEAIAAVRADLQNLNAIIERNLNQRYLPQAQLFTYAPEVLREMQRQGIETGMKLSETDDDRPLSREVRQKNLREYSNLAEYIRREVRPGRHVNDAVVLAMVNMFLALPGNPIAPNRDPDRRARTYVSEQLRIFMGSLNVLGVSKMVTGWRIDPAAEDFSIGNFSNSTIVETDISLLEELFRQEKQYHILYADNLPAIASDYELFIRTGISRELGELKKMDGGPALVAAIYSTLRANVEAGTVPSTSEELRQLLQDPSFREGDKMLAEMFLRYFGLLEGRDIRPRNEVLADTMQWLTERVVQGGAVIVPHASLSNVMENYGIKGHARRLTGSVAQGEAVIVPRASSPDVGGLTRIESYEVVDLYRKGLWKRGPVVGDITTEIEAD